MRIAETEKYAHVTFFLSGGREKEFDGEERVLIPSPKVATYDLNNISVTFLHHLLCVYILMDKQKFQKVSFLRIFNP